MSGSRTITGPFPLGVSPVAEASSLIRLFLGISNLNLCRVNESFCLCRCFLHPSWKMLQATPRSMEALYDFAISLCRFPWICHPKVSCSYLCLEYQVLLSEAYFQMAASHSAIPSPCYLLSRSSSYSSSCWSLWSFSCSSEYRWPGTSACHSHNPRSRRYTNCVLSCIASGRSYSCILLFRRFAYIWKGRGRRCSSSTRKSGCRQSTSNLDRRSTSAGQATHSWPETFMGTIQVLWTSIDKPQLRTPLSCFLIFVSYTKSWKSTSGLSLLWLCISAGAAQVWRYRTFPVRIALKFEGLYSELFVQNTGKQSQMSTSTSQPIFSAESTVSCHIWNS